MQHQRFYRTVFITIVLAVLLIASCYPARDWVADVDRLETLFPILEAKKVKVFRESDWCQLLESANGSFASNSKRNCIFPLTAKPKPFDSIAHQEHNEIWDAIRGARLKVVILDDLKYSPSGQLQYGEFDYSQGFARQRYIYNPDYTLPADIPAERTHDSINPNWYHVAEDWN